MSIRQYRSMRKIISSFIIIVIMTFSYNSTALGAENISVYYNGTKIHFDVNPMMTSGRTLVPMRSIFETFGANVVFDSQKNTITAQKSDLQISLTLNSVHARINRNGTISEVVLDCVPEMVNGRTLVPLRFVGEALGASVNWDNSIRLVSINTIPSPVLDSEKTNLPILTIEQVAKKSSHVVLLKKFDSSGKLISLGSGFIISKDGQIATNYHVIDSAYSMTATLESGRECVIESVLKYDAKKDLAIIKASGIFIENPLILGDSNQVVLGQSVVAIGNPEGLANTVSNGIISSIRFSQERSSTDFQTSTPISHGSSGGPLFNMQGEVIGINYAISVEGQNLNFTIPASDLVKLQSTISLPSTFLAVYTDQHIKLYSNAKYEGSLKDGYPHGFGKMTLNSGEIYNGDWLNGVKTGTGEMFFADGTKYVGGWLNNLMNGFGIFDWPNGNRFEGTLVDGKLDGEAVIYGYDGRIIRLLMKNGETISSTVVSTGSGLGTSQQTISTTATPSVSTAPDYITYNSELNNLKSLYNSTLSIFNQQEEDELEALLEYGAKSGFLGQAPLIALEDEVKLKYLNLRDALKSAFANDIQTLKTKFRIP